MICRESRMGTVKVPIAIFVSSIPVPRTQLGQPVTGKHEDVSPTTRVAARVELVPAALASFAAYRFRRRRVKKCPCSQISNALTLGARSVSYRGDEALCEDPLRRAEVARFARLHKRNQRRGIVVTAARKAKHRQHAEAQRP